jgi:phenylacetate-CoA ligase
MIGKLRLQLIDIIRGTNIMPALEELKKQQYLPETELEKLRQEKITALFNKARKSTSYYSRFSSFNDVPVLTKDIIRENTPGLISSLYKKKLHKKQSGGSTGIPLVYYTTSESQSYLWAGILMSWESAGYTLGDKVAFIAGTSLIKSSFAHKAFYKLFNIDVYPATPLNEQVLSAHLENIRNRKVKIIYGYANVINELADYVRKKKSQLPHLKGIVCTAEILKESTRLNIEDAFGVKVINQYGCNESGTSAFECKAGNMHLISSRIAYSSDNEGNLICTDLANEGFIMLKYFTGDILRFSGEPCSCKRTFPVIKEVIGRTSDIVIDTFNNRLHDSFFYFLFKKEPSVKKFQTSFDENCITVNIQTDHSQPEEYYHPFLEQVKDQVKFKEYKLTMNIPFVLTKNEKSFQIIK